MSRRALAGAAARSPGFRVVELAEMKDIPAPVGGLNSISPLAAMKPTDAITLTNVFPQPGYVEIRRDHQVHFDLDPVATPVESLMAYHALDSADDKLFAVADGDIYDVTTTATASAAHTGLANSRINHTNLATSGGNFLWMANGVDDPVVYDGATFATASITGVTAGDIISGVVWKSRLWLVLINSLAPAYLEPDAFQGTATPFDLQGVFTKGGFLQAIGSWTMDAGTGPDDRLALVSSRGEVAIYAGTDPEDSSFGLVGVFQMGAPIGRRCLTKVGGDLAVISIDGVVPLSQALQTDRASSLKASISAKIQPSVNEDARRYNGNFGWQLIGYPRGTRAILNVPETENVLQHQWVMNTITGAWCRFEGENANCWEVFNDRLFFGGNAGIVYEADVTGVGSGQTFDIDIETAFNKLGNNRLKQFTLCQALLTTDGRLFPGLAANVDFARGKAIDPVTVEIDPLALWDVAKWDEGVWPAVTSIQTDWQSVDGLGTWVSIRMSATITDALADTPDQPLTMQLNGFNIQFLKGGLL